MTLREIASTLGLSHPYFFNYWTFAPSSIAKITSSQRDTKSIFIHIPKTAGMSIHRILYDKDHGHGHAPAYAYYRREPKSFAEYFTFSLMREPTDRFVSAFYYLKTSPLNARDEAWGKQYLEGIESPNDLLNKARSSARQWGRLMSFVHFNPQSWYITDRKGNIIVDYIGRLEEFDASVGEIAKRLGREYKPAQINQSKRPRESNLSPENLEVLHKIYAEDYRIYRERFEEN